MFYKHYIVLFRGVNEGEGNNRLVQSVFYNDLRIFDMTLSMAAAMTTTKRLKRAMVIRMTEVMAEKVKWKIETTAIPLAC